MFVLYLSALCVDVAILLQVLTPLRPREHVPLDWDNRYEPYVRESGFLPLVRMLNMGRIHIDGPLVTVLVDRWRPETHTFHLPCGEMTITLQDIGMILGLRIDGHAVTGDTTNDGWRDRVEAFYGHRPPDAEPGNRDQRTAGVLQTWLADRY